MWNAATFVAAFALLGSVAFAQIGHRFPSEKKIVADPMTGILLAFLTSAPEGDFKIYQTHPQWTSDGKWVIFRSQRVRQQAFAVNEETGVIVQVTENGYMGMLCVARRSMKLYVMRDAAAIVSRPQAPIAGSAGGRPTAPRAPSAPGAAGARGDVNRPRGPFQIVEIDLAKLFADSEAGAMKPAAVYERVCGITPSAMTASGNMGLDANEEVAYFGIRGADLVQKLPAGTRPAERFGPRGMGAGPTGLASMNLKTGEVKLITVVPFEIGHVQANPWMPGEIVFCWETGGKAPQRTWTVMADGTGLRPLYPEAPYEWVTHEAVITKDEVMIALMGHRKVGTGVGVPDPWGPDGTREHPSGLGIVNLRTREMRVIAQTPTGSGLWHVNGSADGRWAVGDDFERSVYLIDRHTGEMVLLTTGHKDTAADHPHPTFNADGTKIEIQSAMLDEDGRSMNICIIPVPKAWLDRTYESKILK